jgi:cyclophilin family peptidyl-prolyl cis-trans isomerase
MKYTMSILLTIVVLASGSLLACSSTAPPTVSFTADLTIGTAPLIVQFTDQSTGEISDWLWDFGDGQTSTDQNPSHSYDTPGAFTVSLTVTNSSDSNIKTRTDYIAVNRIATIETSMGIIKFELYEQRAPITTVNFINLAESGFYDGLIFHRVDDDFVIQTGDPTGTGAGGSDDTIVLEIDEELTHTDGAVGMARSSAPDSATSQFYICDGAQHALDGNYAVFGQVMEGIDVVRAIAEVSVDENDKPLDDVLMITVSIQSA